MTVITISRELGSHGDTIANLLCDRLGYCRVDKAMIMQLAQDAGVNVEAIAAAERDLSRKARLISSDLTSLYRKQPSAFEKTTGVDEQTYTRVLRETMERFAAQGNAVIVGRGGQIILRDWPDALHVHLYAPVEVRVRRIAEQYNLSEDTARQRIDHSDEERRHYFRVMHQNANWKALQYYHLAIDTARISPELTAEMIVRAAEAPRSA
jgi:cytidylate kinase